MIVVIGRPALDADGQLAGTASRIAATAARDGARVELVGSVGDDVDGDGVAVALGQARIGHAALLRDPAATTPRGEGGTGEPPLPRLDATDVQLALEYLPECRVLVVAEELDRATLAVAGEAARYHAAQAIVVLPPGTRVREALPEGATVLERPADDGGAFAELVGRYAAGLAAGREPADAWRAAVDAGGWEESAEEESRGPR